MRSIRPLLATLTSFLLLTGGSAAQAPSITIGGEVPNPVTVTANELAALPRHRVTASDHGGPSATYEGVNLRDVLKLAGVEVGATLRGPRLAMVVLVEARDGYRIALALADLDPGFRDKQIVLVDRMNGTPLNEAAGPWRLVIPEENRGARWIRQISRISVVTVKPPAS